MSRDSLAPLRFGAARCSSSAAAPVPPELPCAELRAMLSRLCRSADIPSGKDLQRLRAELAKCEHDSRGATRWHDRLASSRRMLEAVLDSPLDLDSALFARLLSTLPAAPSPQPAGSRPGNLRVDNAHPLKSADLAPVVEATATPALTTFDQDAVAGLMEQVRATKELLGRQAVTVSQRRFEKTHALPAMPENRHLPTPCVDQSQTPGQIRCRNLAGLHVRQANHDFVIPVENIAQVLAAPADGLPTILGRPVANVAGQVCDVVFLASEMGLETTSASRAMILIAILERDRKICLAMDEVVGLVREPIISLDTLLPKVTSLRGIIRLKSGRLALVPDFSHLDAS